AESFVKCEEAQASSPLLPRVTFDADVHPAGRRHQNRGSPARADIVVLGRATREANEHVPEVREIDAPFNPGPPAGGQVILVPLAAAVDVESAVANDTLRIRLIQKHATACLLLVRAG